MRKVGLTILMLLIISCQNRKNEAVANTAVSDQKNKTTQQTKIEKPKVTFVELGSVRCIPCQQMQPVMKAIEEKYGEQIEVVFYDVWQQDQKHFADDYKIRVIPTQVFLDEKGVEFFRHEGFFPEDEIHKLLQERGLKIKN